MKLLEYEIEEAKEYDVQATYRRWLILIYFWCAILLLLQFMNYGLDKHLADVSEKMMVAENRNRLRPPLMTDFHN